MIYIEDLRINKWPGTQTDCGYDAVTQALMPGSTNTWSDYSGGSWTDMNQWNDAPVSQMVYGHPAIDLGVSVSFKPLVTLGIASGTVTIEESHSDDNSMYSTYAAAGAQITTRYLKLRITVDNPALTGITQATGCQ